MQYDRERLRAMQHRRVRITQRSVVAWLLAATLLSLMLPANAETADGDDVATPTSATQDASEQGIQFYHGSFDEALQLAKDEEKSVFVDVYTVWCGPCVVMQETVFREPKVGEYFNKRFVSFKFDAEDESQNGPELAARYDIGVYPTYLLLDPDGKEVNRASGSMTADRFIAMVSQLLGESSSSFDLLQERYADGDRSLEFLQQFLLDAMVELGLRPSPEDTLEGVREYFAEYEKYQAIAEEYFIARTYPELINDVDVQLIMFYLERIPRGHEVVEFVIANYDDVLAVSSDAAMSQFALNATLGAVAESAQVGDEKFTQYIEALYEKPLIHAVEYERNRYASSSLLPEAMKSNWEIRFLVAKADWNELLAVYQTRFEKQDDVSARQYSAAARDLSRSEVQAHREVAVEYGKRAFELDSKDPMVAVSYLGALHATGRGTELRRIAETYRGGLSESEADQAKRALFERVAAGWLQEPTDEALTDESEE